MFFSNLLERFGTLHGVVHAAGALEDGTIALKNPAVAARVLAPKLTGTLVVDTVTGDLDLDFTALFSSTSAPLGPAGQVDYAAANAFLNAHARSRWSPRSRTIALGWGAWTDVGMATRTARGAVQGPPLENRTVVEHPFLEGCVTRSPQEVVYSAPFALEDSWLVREHQIEGFGALMPGTGYLEMARACYANEVSNRPVEIREVFFTTPFRVCGGERRDLSISLRPINGHYAFRMSSLDPSGRTVDHVQGELEALSRPAPAFDSLPSIRARCVADSKAGTENPHFRFGRRWDNLKRVEFGEGEVLATIELPEEFIGDLQQVPLHPALLDMATSCGLPLVEGFDPQREFYVPVSCASIRVFDGLGRFVHSHVRLQSEASGADFVSFDVEVRDIEGRVLVAIDDFTFRRATNDSLSRVSSKQASPTEGGTPPRQSGVSISGGIPPEKGVRAFELVLSSFFGDPEILISPESIESQFQKLGGTITSDSSSVGVRRDQDDTGLDEIEEATRNLWRGILGIDDLGNSEDFFDSGADSLSALKAVAQIRRRFAVRLSVSELYEHPTVERLANIIKRLSKDATA